MTHRAMVPERVPGEASERWEVIDKLGRLRDATAVAYRCILCSSRVEDTGAFTGEDGSMSYRCEGCALRGQTQIGLAITGQADNADQGGTASTDLTVVGGNNQACVDGWTEFLLYSALPPYQVVQAQAVEEGTVLVGAHGQPVRITAVVSSPRPSSLLRLGPALHVSANHPVNSGQGWCPAGTLIGKGRLQQVQCGSTWNFATKDSKPLLCSDGIHLIATIGHHS